MENSHNTPLLLQPIKNPPNLYSIIFWATWTHLFAFFIDHRANNVSSWVTFCTCLTDLWQISPRSMKTPYNSQNGVLAELFYLWILECSRGRIREAGGGERQWCSVAAFLSSVCPFASSSARWFQLRATWMKDFSSSLLSWGYTESWGKGRTEKLQKIMRPWEFTVVSKSGWTEQGKILLSQLLQFGSGWEFVSHISEVKWLPWCHSEVTTQKCKFCILGANFL